MKCIIQITHEERKNARRDHRMKESGYGSDRASSDRQVGHNTMIYLIFIQCPCLIHITNYQYYKFFNFRMILTEKGVAEIGIGTVIDMIADVVAQGAGLVIEEVVAEDIDRDHEIVIDTLNPTGDQDPEIEKEEDALGHIREKEGNIHIL